MSLRRFRRFQLFKRPADLSKVPETLQFTVDPFYDGWRLDAYLSQLLTWHSRARLVRRIEEGGVRKNGQVVPPGRRVREGDVIVVDVPPPTEDMDAIANIELPILFEDDYFVAVDKPPNLLAHPVGQRRFTSVVNLLHARYRNLEDPQHDVVPILAHRIDQETSGVLLVTLSREMRRAMTRLFVRGEVEKSYLALVEGHIEPREGLIDLPIGPRPEHEIRITRRVNLDDPDRQDAQTRYAVVARIPATPGHDDGFDLVHCELVSGRQHQIRVHMEAIGHPLVGDPYYGRRRRLSLPSPPGRGAGGEGRDETDASPESITTHFESRRQHAITTLTERRILGDLPLLNQPRVDLTAMRSTMLPDPLTASEGATGQRPRPVGYNPSGDPSVLIDRMALHSTEMRFTHPATGEPVRIIAPLPEDVLAVLVAKPPEPRT